MKKTLIMILLVFTCLLGIFVVSVNDFDIRFAPIYLATWLVLGVCILLLKKYGKGIIYEE